MTIEETKAWMHSYRFFVRESERIEEDLEYWRSRAEKMTREMTSQPSGSGGEKSMETAIEKIMELEDKLSEQHRLILEQKTAIEAAIDSLSDETCRLLLKLKYINGNTWGQVSAKLYLSERHAKRLCRKALKDINMSLNVTLNE